jgi:quinol monooxygenase YgiN
MMVTVLATVRLIEGKEAEFEAVFAERRVRVLATEPDTLTYDLFRSQEDKSLYTVIESYPSKAAHEAHMKASVGHEKMMVCFAERPTMIYLDAVPGCS